MSSKQVQSFCMEQVLGRPETAALILRYMGRSLANAILATPMFAQAIVPAMAKGDWLRCSYAPKECMDFSLVRMRDFQVVLWLLDNLYDDEAARARAASQVLFLVAGMPGLPVEHSVVQALAAKCGDINMHKGVSLNKAAQAGHTQMVRSLLALGANITSSPMGALNFAVWSGHSHVAKLLLDAGADIEAPGLRGTTPLFAAVEAKHLEVAELLLGRGANIEATKPDGSTPLLVAVKDGNKDMVDLLLRHGANMEVHSDGFGQFGPLHIAVMNNHREVTQLLLNRGANVDTASPQNGWTPLHVAARKRNLWAVQLLLARGARRDAAAQDGSTPLSIAEERGHTEVANLLRPAANDMLD